MFTVLEITTIDLLEKIKATYYQLYGNQSTQSIVFLIEAAERILATLAQGNAPYHNVEHTILVTAVGQEILLGKQRLDGQVTPHNWLHYTLALLCHDIGYIQGACLQDVPWESQYWVSSDSLRDGKADHTITLNSGATDASLAPYHIERSKHYVHEQFSTYSFINVELIQRYIEHTRFPVPTHCGHQSTSDYAGLTRAADLIGQLSDPRYLQKTVALFAEFEETGANRRLGYNNADDLWLGYPTFFRKLVYPYLGDAIRYLHATFAGKQVVASLYSNVATAEKWSRLN
ncbi:MAG: metal-dependent phosphohydrolase [Thainema sp.]